MAALDTSARPARRVRRIGYDYCLLEIPSVLQDASLLLPGLIWTPGKALDQTTTDIGKMVTTRSQDKMSVAEKLRAQGFSLADCKFLKLNALFPVMLGLAHATCALWCGSGLAAAVVGAVPVADEKVARGARKLIIGRRPNSFPARRER